MASPWFLPSNECNGGSHSTVQREVMAYRTVPVLRVVPSLLRPRPPSRARWVAKGLALAILFVSALEARLGTAQTLQIENPLVLQRADPDIYRHTDGYYYFTATVPAYDLIELRRADTIQGLSSAAPTVIWRAHPSGEMASHIWAPEIHSVDGGWYVYFAAGSSSDVWDIRVYVLSNASPNPLEGTWQERGQLMTNGPKASGAFFALDATTFEHGGVRYLVWAESDPEFDANTVLYIAPMSNPWTLAARGVRISAPEEAWERVGYAVNEGPAVLKRNGKVFISYSASATDANYCLGLLTAEDTSDLLDPRSWSKASQPVFRSGNGVFGPGHNQFTTTPDGSVDLIVYHGRDYERIDGDPLNDPNRATRVKPLAWHADGTPDFGAPLADGTLTIELEANGGAAGAAGAPNGGQGGADHGGAPSPPSGGIGGSVGGTGGATASGGAGTGAEGTATGGASGGDGGLGGTAGVGGSDPGSGGGGGGGAAVGGTPASGGTSTGGIPASGGASVGGSASGGSPTGGNGSLPSAGTGGVGAAAVGGSTGGSATGGSPPVSEPVRGDERDSGCGCSLPGSPARSGAAALAALGLCFALGRRSRARGRQR